MERKKHSLLTGWKVSCAGRIVIFDPSIFSRHTFRDDTSIHIVEIWAMNLNTEAYISTSPIAFPSLSSMQHLEKPIGSHGKPLGTQKHLSIVFQICFSLLKDNLTCIGFIMNREGKQISYAESFKNY